MKKIFTLIVSLGLLTASFAQDGRHDIPSKSHSYDQTYDSQGGHKKYSNSQPERQDRNSGNWNFQSNERNGPNKYGHDNFSQDRYGKGNDWNGRLEDRDNSRFNPRMRFDDPRMKTGNSLLSLVFNIISHK